MPRRKQLWYMVSVAAALGVASAVIYPYSQAAATQRNLARARDHIKSLQTVIVEDVRFQAIVFVESPYLGGSIVVSGSVATKTDLEALRSAVDASHPPVLVVWTVGALDDATTANPL